MNLQEEIDHYKRKSELFNKMYESAKEERDKESDLIKKVKFAEMADDLYDDFLYAQTKYAVALSKQNHPVRHREIFDPILDNFKNA